MHTLFSAGTSIKDVVEMLIVETRYDLRSILKVG